MNIFIARLASEVTNDSLRNLFEQYGAVDTAKVIFDRETGNSRGFGFVEMADTQEANSAIQALDESQFLGRKIVVKEAEARESRNTGGGGGGAQRRPYQQRQGGGGGGGYSRSNRYDRDNRDNRYERDNRESRDNRDNRYERYDRERKSDSW